MTYRFPTTREVYSVPRTSAEQDNVELKFFKCVVLPNGTYKTTNASRLDDLNKFALPLIQRKPWAGARNEPIKIMDVGVSSGVSTLEWYQQLKTEGLDCDVTGTDITLYVSWVVLTSQLSALIDREQNILHLDIFGRGVPPRAESPKGVYRWIVRMLFRVAMLIDADLSPMSGHVREPASGRLLRCTPITLLTKKFIQREDLRVMEDDLLTTNKESFKKVFHVVRAANILNRAYFSDQTLNLMVERLKERMIDGGLLILCRTTDAGINNATIFRLAEDRSLCVLQRLNGGSEIENILSREPQKGDETVSAECLRENERSAQSD